MDLECRHGAKKLQHVLVKYTIILTDQYNLKLGNKQKKFQRGRWTVDIAVNYKFISIKFR